MTGVGQYPPTAPRKSYAVTTLRVALGQVFYRIVLDHTAVVPDSKPSLNTMVGST